VVDPVREPREARDVVAEPAVAVGRRGSDRDEERPSRSTARAAVRALGLVIARRSRPDGLGRRASSTIRSSARCWWRIIQSFPVFNQTSA
jgi:hypothetical protein